MTWYNVGGTNLSVNAGDVVGYLPGVSSGVVVCRTDNGWGAEMQPSGIALSSGTTGSAIQVAVVGVVAKPILGLSDPTAGYLGLDLNTGRTVRIDPSADLSTVTGPILGMVLADGSGVLIGVSALRSTIGKLSSELDTIKRTTAPLVGQIAALSAALANVQTVNGTLTTRLGTLEAQVAKLSAGGGAQTPGTGSGTTTPTTGSALARTGTVPTARVLAPRVPALRITGPMTAEIWLRPDALRDTQMVMGTDHDQECMLIIDTASGAGTATVGAAADTVISFKCGDNGAGRITLSVAKRLTVGTWTHFACVRSVDSAGWISVRLLMNGVVIASKDKVRQGVIAAPGYPWAVPGSSSSTWAGAFAEWRVWKRARTDAEIAADFRKRLTGTEADLVGYWPVKETGTPSTVAHATNAALNATVTGFTATTAPF